MKRLFLFACTLFAVLSSMAQEIEYVEREHIMNLSEYSQFPEGGTRRIGSRSSAPLPCTGSPKVPVVLVNFSDLKFSAAETDAAVHEFYHKFFNGSGIKGEQYRVPGGIWGSVSDYFIEQSDSLFQPEFTVIGPVTISQGFEYYGEGVHDMSSRLNQFFVESCQQAASEDNVNWSDFDNNNDGVIDFIFFIYAGLGENDSNNPNQNTIWPHEQATKKTIEGLSFGGYGLSFGGYGCGCELVRVKIINTSTGEVKYRDDVDGIGLTCHELSHGLGLPDLYDYNKKLYGMDYFDLMDSGSFQLTGDQPCGYSAYERDFMGWRPLKQVAKDEQVTLTLEPIETGGFGYKVLNDGDPSGNEYFILENRQNIGFDTYYGCRHSNDYAVNGAMHGLVITHVTYNASDWSSNRLNTGKQRYTIVPADGTLYPCDYTNDYAQSLRGDIYPGSQYVREMSDYSVATGTFTQTIRNITEHEDGTVTVDINKEVEPDGIVSTKTDGTTIIAVFSLAGQQQEGLRPGVNIVKYSNGQMKKVLIK